MNIAKKAVVSKLIAGVFLAIGLFCLGKTTAVQAAPAPIFVQFRSVGNALSENIPGAKINIGFTTINDVNAPAVAHGNIDIQYKITGTANTDDYIFNNQPSVTTGVIHVPAGSGDFFASLRVNNDSLYEDNETVVITIVNVVHLNSAVPLKIGKFYSFTETILNDDVACNLNIRAITDTPKIIAPDSPNVKLGSWRFAVENEKAVLSRLTLQTVYANGSGVASAFDGFGTLKLYHGPTEVDTASYINGTVVFNNVNVALPQNSEQIFTLRGNINSSGILTNNTPIRFAVKSDNPADIEVRCDSGMLLGTADINHDISSSSGAPEFQFAPSTVHVFHDAFPVIQALPLSGYLAVDSQATIFKFRVTNAGTVNLRLAGTKIATYVYGLPFSGGGTISDFRLYDYDTGIRIAQNNLVVNATTANPSSITFDSSNDLNGILDDFYIAPGSSKTFFMTANTINMTMGLGSGNAVILFANLEGAAGWNGTAWNTGNLFYFYTPVASSIEQGVFGASDSYVVPGPLLSFVL